MFMISLLTLFHTIVHLLYVFGWLFLHFLVGKFCSFVIFSLNVKIQLPHIMIKIILLSREPLERNWLVDVSAEDLKAMIHQKVKGRSMCRRPKDRKSRYW